MNSKFEDFLLRITCAIADGLAFLGVNGYACYIVFEGLLRGSNVIPFSVCSGAGFIVKGNKVTTEREIS